MKINITNNDITNRPTGTLNPHHVNRSANIRKTYENFSKIQLNCMDQSKVAEAYSKYLQSQQNALDENVTLTALAEEEIAVEQIHEIYDESGAPNSGVIKLPLSAGILSAKKINSTALSAKRTNARIDAGFIDFMMRKMDIEHFKSASQDYLVKVKQVEGTHGVTYHNHIKLPNYMNVESIDEQDLGNGYSLLALNLFNDTYLSLEQDGSGKMVTTNNTEFDITTEGYFLDVKDSINMRGELFTGIIAIPRFNFRQDGFSLVYDTLHTDVHKLRKIIPTIIFEVDSIDDPDHSKYYLQFSFGDYEGDIYCTVNLYRDQEMTDCYYSLDIRSMEMVWSGLIAINVNFGQQGITIDLICQSENPNDDLTITTQISHMFYGQDAADENIMIKWDDLFYGIHANVGTITPKRLYNTIERNTASKDYQNYLPSYENNWEWVHESIELGDNANEVLMAKYGCGYFLDWAGSRIHSFAYGYHQGPFTEFAKLMNLTDLIKLLNNVRSHNPIDWHPLGEFYRVNPGEIKVDNYDYDGCSCNIQIATEHDIGRLRKCIPDALCHNQYQVLQLIGVWPEHYSRAIISLAVTINDMEFHTKICDITATDFSNGKTDILIPLLEHTPIYLDIFFLTEDEDSDVSVADCYSYQYNEVFDDVTDLGFISLFMTDLYAIDDGEAFTMLNTWQSEFAFTPTADVYLNDECIYHVDGDYRDSYNNASYAKLPVGNDYVSGSHIIYQAILDQSDIEVNVLTGILTGDVVNVDSIRDSVRQISIDNYSNIISLSDAAFNDAGEYIANFSDKLNEFKIKFGDVTASELQRFQNTFNKWKDRTTSFISKMTKAMNEVRNAADTAISSVKAGLGVLFNDDKPETYNGSSTVNAWVSSTELTGLKAVGTAAAMGVKAIFSGFKALFNRVVKPIIKKVVDMIDPLFNGVILKENKSGTKEGVDIPVTCYYSQLSVRNYALILLNTAGFVTTGDNQDVTEADIEAVIDCIIDDLKTFGKVTKCIETSFCLIQFALVLDDGGGSDDINIDAINAQTSLQLYTQVNYKLTTPINKFNNGCLTVFTRPVTDVQTTDAIGRFGFWCNDQSDIKFYHTVKWAFNSGIKVQDYFDAIFENDDGKQINFKDTEQQRENIFESLRTAYVKTEWLLFILFTLTTGSSGNTIWDMNYTSYKTWFREEQWHNRLIHAVPPTCEIVDYSGMFFDFELDALNGNIIAEALLDQMDKSVTFEFSSVLPPINNNQHKQKVNFSSVGYVEDQECVIDWSGHRNQLSYGYTIQYKRAFVNADASTPTGFNLAHTIMQIANILNPWEAGSVMPVDINDEHYWHVLAEAPTNCMDVYCKYADSNRIIRNPLNANQRIVNRSLISLLQHTDYNSSIAAPRRAFNIDSIELHDYFSDEDALEQKKSAAAALFSIIACNTKEFMVLLNKYYPNDSISCFIPYWDVDYNADFKLRVATDDDNATYGAILVTAIAAAVMLVIGVALIGVAALKIKKLLRTKRVMRDTIEWNSADRCNSACNEYMQAMEDRNNLITEYRNATNSDDKIRIKELLKENRQIIKQKGESFVAKCASTAKLKRKAMLMTTFSGGLLGAVGSISDAAKESNMPSASNNSSRNVITDAANIADKFSSKLSTDSITSDLVDIPDEIDLSSVTEDTNAIMRAFNITKNNNH